MYQSSNTMFLIKTPYYQPGFKLFYDIIYSLFSFKEMLSFGPDHTLLMRELCWELLLLLLLSFGPEDS